MLRTALFAVLLTGLASTAMASDRVRVVVSYDSGHGYHSVRDRGYYYRDRDRDYRHRGHYSRDDRRWDRGRHYGWRGDRYYSRPYYRSYDRGYYGSRSYRDRDYGDRGYYYGSRGYRHDRYCPDRWHRH